jgi:hypothetical protein
MPRVDVPLTAARCTRSRAVNPGRSHVRTRRLSTPDRSAQLRVGPVFCGSPANRLLDVCQVSPPTCVQVSKRSES